MTSKFMQPIRKFQFKKSSYLINSDDFKKGLTQNLMLLNIDHISVIAYSLHIAFISFIKNGISLSIPFFLSEHVEKNPIFLHITTKNYTLKCYSFNITSNFTHGKYNIFILYSVNGNTFVK